MPYGDFQPSQGRDFLGDQVSLISRADQNQRANNQEAREKYQFEAMKPAIAARMQADIVSAHASVANQARLESLRTKAATESIDFNQEFLDASALPDFAAQSRALASLQGKVAYMDILPEYKGFVTAVNDARAKAHVGEITNLKLDEQSMALDKTLASRETIAQENSQLRANMQQQAADLKREMEGQRAQHRKEMEGVKAGYVAQNQNTKVATAGSYKENQTYVQQGIAAQPALAQIDTALALLDDPDVRTGSGAALELKAERLGSIFGADFKGVQKTEQLQTLLGQTMLAKARELRGPISDKDLVFLEQVSPSLSKTPEGNKRILAALKKGYENASAVAKIVSDMRQDGELEPAINNAVAKYSLSHSVFGDSGSPAASASKAPTVSTQAEFDALPSGSTFLTPSGKTRRKP